jgi:hypothetical protein
LKRIVQSHIQGWDCPGYDADAVLERARAMGAKR